MSVKSLLHVFERVFNGIIDTREGQKSIHRFCTSEGLNPVSEEPISALMATSRGQGLIRHYETFMNQINWLLAQVAAKEVEPEVAVFCLEKELQKLECFHVYPEGEKLFIL